MVPSISNKGCAPENSIAAAVTLLNAADYCNHSTMAIEEAIVLIKTSFHQNASTRKLIRILLTVSKALPIISNSVKIRAGNGAPVNSNPSYARARLQTVSNEATLTGASKLQSLVDSAQSLVDSTPSRKSSRKRVVVTPDRDSLPPDLPEPLNGKYYSVIEAVAKFKACPKKKGESSCQNGSQENGFQIIQKVGGTEHKRN